MNKGVWWIVGAVLLVLLLEAAPKIGAGLLAALVLYLLIRANARGLV